MATTVAVHAAPRSGRLYHFGTPMRDDATMARIAVAVAVGCLVLAAVAVAWILLQPGVTARSGVYPDVTIKCGAATAMDAPACLAWGDQVLLADPAPLTFERSDLARLQLDRSLLGWGGTCTVAYYVGRYPDDPVWSGEVPCP
jgi:hypothetical protein